MRNMNLKEKEKFFISLAKDFEVMDYPPVTVWRMIKRECIREGWRKRVKEILRGEKDYPGLYFHIPYCRSKCFYCRYISRICTSPRTVSPYLRCLRQEIEDFAPLFKRVSFKTLYLAGGTPTILSPHQLNDLFSFLEKKFNLRETYQRIIESTPFELSAEKLKVLKKFRFDRLTIGIQTADSKLTKLTNRRIQSRKIIKEAFIRAKSAGIKYINSDLIVGFPGQGTSSFLKDVDFLLGLRPSAIHLYPYRENEHVIFYKMGKRISEEDKKRAEAMLVLADRKIKSCGYRQYRNEPYLLTPEAANFQMQFRYLNSSLLGFGAGALSYIPNQYAYHNPVLDDYLSSCLKEKFPRFLEGYRLSKKAGMINYVMNNIRPGIDKKMYFNLFGSEFDSDFREEVESLRRLNRLEESGGKVKLIANSNFEYKVYSKFFYSPKVIKEIQNHLKK